MRLLKKLLEKIKGIFSKENILEKEWGLKSISFATENSKHGVFVLVATFALFLGLLLVIQGIKTSEVLKAKAAGTSIGSKVFCGDKRLCSDGRCEGEVWQDCSNCPYGKAKAVMEVSCGKYVESGCSMENYDCK